MAPDRAAPDVLPQAPAAVESMNPKASGMQLYREVLGSPKYVVAPMVDQSELAWRILSRLYGAELCYTPMIHSRLFSDHTNTRYRKEQFDMETGEEGDPVLDRPLIAQFCANDPDIFLAAVKVLEGKNKVDAVDLNCGCPQGIASRGKYGAFLMEDWPLIGRLVSRIDAESSIPITAKFRCYPSTPETVSYASHFLSSGAQLLTLHGRTRAQKGQYSGLADWTKIAAAKRLVDSQSTSPDKSEPPVALFANGNILISEDVGRCLEATGADGVMSAEGNLYNPAIFLPLNRVGAARYRERLPSDLQAALAEVDATFPPPQTADKRQAKLDEEFPLSTKVALQYLAICRTIKTATGSSAIKAHLYKLWRPIFAAGKHLDLRDRLGRTHTVEADGHDAVANSTRIQPYWDVAMEMKGRIEDDDASGALDSFDLPDPLPAGIPLPGIPYSRTQPYFRPLPVSAVQPSVDLAGVQAAGETQVGIENDEPGAKRVKLDSGTVLLSTTEAGKLPVCANEDCGNAASARCPRGGCKACCATMTPSSAEAPEEAGRPCEAHRARLEMEKKRDEDKLEAKKKRKEAGKKKKVEAAGRQQQQKMQKSAGRVVQEQVREVTVDA